MGYYTRYDLSITDAKTGVNNMQEFRAVLKDAEEAKKLTDQDREKLKESYVKRLEDSLKKVQKVNPEIWQWLDCSDDMKWYEHEDHMRSLSKAFPEFLFQLDGIGESSDDQWRKWFLNGKMQGGKAKIVMPELQLGEFK